MDLRSCIAGMRELGLLVQIDDPIDRDVEAGAVMRYDVSTDEPEAHRRRRSGGRSPRAWAKAQRRQGAASLKPPDSGIAPKQDSAARPRLNMD
jgi:hypothetical protein